MPEFRIRLEFDVEVDNPSHIDAAFAAAEWLEELPRKSSFDRLVYEVAPHDYSRGVPEFKTVDLEEIQSIDEDYSPDIDDPIPSIDQTCCGKCPGATCYVDQITGA